MPCSMRSPSILSVMAAPEDAARDDVVGRLGGLPLEHVAHVEARARPVEALAAAADHRLADVEPRVARLDPVVVQVG